MNPYMEVQFEENKKKKLCSASASRWHQNEWRANEVSFIHSFIYLFKYSSIHGCTSEERANEFRSAPLFFSKLRGGNLLQRRAIDAERVPHCDFGTSVSQDSCVTLFILKYCARFLHISDWKWCPQVKNTEEKKADELTFRVACTDKFFRIFPGAWARQQWFGL